MFGPQVLLEYSVGDKKAGGRVDIALKGSRGVVALIEAKAPGEDLKIHVTQVLGYAFHEGVDICALTTGLEWWLYLPREKGQPEERRFRALNIINDPVEELADDLHAFLSNQALEAGTAVPQAKRVLQAQHERDLLSERIPSIWRRMIDEADEELIEIVSKRVYGEVNLRPDKQQVVAVLRGQPVTTAALPDKGPQPDARSVKSPKAVTRTARSDSTGRRPTAIVLFGERFSIRANNEGLVKLLEVLLTRNPTAFPSLLQIRGRTRHYLSRNPDQLHTARRIGASEYFVEANLSAARTWKTAHQFLDRLGYQESDLEVRYD